MKELLDARRQTLIQSACQSLGLRFRDIGRERETPAFLVVSEEAGEVRRDGWKVFLELGRRRESVAEPRPGDGRAVFVPGWHVLDLRNDDIAYEFVAGQQRLVHALSLRQTRRPQVYISSKTTACEAGSSLVDQCPTEAIGKFGLER